MKFTLKLAIVVFGIIIIGSGCQEKWDNHYSVYPETVDKNMWEVMQQDQSITKFVELVKSYKLDTLFNSDIPYTVFAPTNEALTSFLGRSSFDRTVLGYHISSHFINTASVQGKRQVQTLTEKFALFEKKGNVVTIDGVQVKTESPLYLNGKYFTMDQVVEPKPNLYEYFKITNPVLSNFIDKQDTIILDKEKSKPLGFDDKGNTVYDTVSIIMNKFEMKYFPVKEEYRTLSGTIVFPKADDYNRALDKVADALGDKYVDHKDIPIEWQEEILIPHLLAQGVFLNRLEPEEFLWKTPKDTLKLLNVLGDSVKILYKPTDKALCSNGYAYNYLNYTIPDSLFNGGTKYEGEQLLKPTGFNKYTWRDSVVVKTDIALTPLQELVPKASNDSIIRVAFPKGYTGNFSIQFKSPKLFPRKYVMIISTHMDIGGLYNIYVNDELIKTFDYYDYVRFRGLMFSVTGERYLPVGRFNKFDMYVENITKYGSAKIKIEYKGPSTLVPSNGLVIDYIEFKPVSN